MQECRNQEQLSLSTSCKIKNKTVRIKQDQEQDCTHNARSRVYANIKSRTTTLTNCVCHVHVRVNICIHRHCIIVCTLFTVLIFIHCISVHTMAESLKSIVHTFYNRPMLLQLCIVVVYQPWVVHQPGHRYQPRVVTLTPQGCYLTSIGVLSLTTLGCYLCTGGEQPKSCYGNNPICTELQPKLYRVWNGRSCPWTPGLWSWSDCTSLPSHMGRLLVTIYYYSSATTRGSN